MRHVEQTSRTGADSFNPSASVSAPVGTVTDGGTSTPPTEQRTSHDDHLSDVVDVGAALHTTRALTFIDYAIRLA